MTERHLCGDDGWQGILGQVQRLGRSVEASLREGVAEETGRDVGDVFRHGEVPMDFLAMPTCCEPLPGKRKAVFFRTLSFNGPLATAALPACGHSLPVSQRT